MNNPHSTVNIAGHPIHPLLVPLPITFLISAFLCDIGFWITEDDRWATTAMWALGAGIVTALLAALVGIVDFLGDGRIRRLTDAWLHLVGNLIAVIIACVNFYVRFRAGAVAGVFPVGIWLSLVVVLLLAFTGWKGGELVFRHRVAVLEDQDSSPR
jgi:uncharacterized membrane protein